MSLFSSWRSHWRNAQLRAELLVTLFLLVITLVGLSRFLVAVEARPGVVLADPVLALFAPIDLTWLAFALIYGGLILAITLLLAEPERLVLAIQCYVAMVCVRIIAMACVPLDPPPTMIPLVDPTVSTFGTGITLSRDLFFSGHTATMFVLSLTVRTFRWRVLFTLATAAVALCVLIQHAHYAIDVIAAPFFAYGAYRLTLLARATLKLPRLEAAPRV